MINFIILWLLIGLGLCIWERKNLPEEEEEEEEEWK